MGGVAFSHVGFYVRDLERMAAFYTRVLGLVITDRGDLGHVQLVFLSRDPQEHHQVVLASGKPDDATFNTINQLSFRVPDLATLRRVHARLACEAVTEVLPAMHGNAVSVYFRDPEGNRVELFFDTPWYCRQPLRVPFDFADDDAAIMARVEGLARATPDFMPRAQWVEKMRALMADADREEAARA